MLFRKEKIKSFLKSDFARLSGIVLLTGFVFLSLTNSVTSSGPYHAPYKPPYQPQAFSLKFVKKLDLNCEVNGIDVAGQTVYLACGQKGLQTVNIAHPEKASLGVSYDIPGYAEDVKVQGRNAYIADGVAGLKVISINNYQAASNKNLFYRVKKGDCLWKIAQERLGEGRRYPEIINKNIKQYPSIRNTVIYPKWTLRVVD